MERALGTARHPRGIRDLEAGEGPEPAYAATFAQTLEGLAARPRVEGISLGELALRYPDAWSTRISPVDPLAAYDTRSQRETVLRTRTYDSSYLAHLETIGT